jgi:membrane protein YdbS with pleckstrin-like domain
MELNKAIRKQKKSYKIFMLSMSFIFFIMPLALRLLNKLSLFFLSYLVLLELLIVIAVVVKTNYESFSYEINLDRLVMKDGIFKSQYNISCEKVQLVHAEEREDGIDLVILITSRVRNKKIKLIDKELLKKYAVVSHEYSIIKKLNPETEYYYIVIKRGGFVKYNLLLDLYKNCVKAKYTRSSIENIKEWLS